VLTSTPRMVPDCTMLRFCCTARFKGEAQT
jgi:hypothetical protein